MERGPAYDRYARLTDGPLTVLALAMLPLLIVPLAATLPKSADQAIVAADYVIWALFALDYAIRLYLSPQRGRFVRTHIPDLIIVVVPFLRPLRVLRSARLLRLLRLTRLAALAAKALTNVRAILRSRGLNYVLLVAVALVFLAAALVVEFERGHEAASIESYPDALWWAVTTITTVGYGDAFPLSPAGRGVAVFLMVAGIAVFGVLTASIAAYFVEQKESPDPTPHLEAISARLDAIEARLSRLDGRASP